MVENSRQERFSNVELLAEIITKQTELKKINLGDNEFSSNATLTIMTRFADFGTSSKLQKLDLMSSGNFEADETVEKLADVI